MKELMHARMYLGASVFFRIALENQGTHQDAYKILVALTMMISTGCGFAERHPTQVKVYALVGGAAIGAGVSLATRTQFCHYTYIGAPYYGTTCSNPDRPTARPVKGTGQ